MNAIRGLGPASLALIAIFAFGPSHADSVTLAPVKDNTLYEPIEQDAYADMSHGAGPTMFAGKVKDARNQAGQVALRRAVVEFDVAGSIPAGAVIDSVQLTMYCDKVAQNASFNVALHRLLSEWGEGTSNTGNSQQGRGEPATPNDATWRHTALSLCIVVVASVNARRHPGQGQGKASPLRKPAGRSAVSSPAPTTATPG